MELLQHIVALNRWERRRYIARVAHRPNRWAVLNRGLARLVFLALEKARTQSNAGIE